MYTFYLIFYSDIFLYVNITDLCNSQFLQPIVVSNLTQLPEFVIRLISCLCLSHCFSFSHSQRHDRIKEIRGRRI